MTVREPQVDVVEQVLTIVESTMLSVQIVHEHTESVGEAAVASANMISPQSTTRVRSVLTTVIQTAIRSKDEKNLRAAEICIYGMDITYDDLWLHVVNIDLVSKLRKNFELGRGAGEEDK